MKIIRKIKGIPTKEYRAWKAMKARCYAPCNKNMGKYQEYKIEVSKEWKNSYETFMLDMGPAPSLEHSLDRINTKKGYCKENCRWATKKEQANNRGNFNILITFNGKTLVLKDWANLLNIKYTTLYNRLYRSKLPFEKAIFDKK